MRDTDDTGQYSNDNLTKDTNVRFTWTGNSNGGSGIRQYWYGWNTSANDYSTGNEYADASAPSANGTYTFYVGAEAVSGLWAYYPDYSDQETVTWDTEPPAPPTFGSPAEWQDLADTTPALSWSAPFDTSGIWHYEVKIRAHSFPLDMEEHVFGYPTYNITGTTFTVPIGDALGYKAFGWQLSATDKAGNVGSLGRNGIADEWGHFNVVEPPGTPGTPNLAAEDDTGYSASDDITYQTSALTFSWSSASGAERYYYAWDTATPSSTYTTSLSADVSAPAGNGNHTFYVRAWNSISGYGGTSSLTVYIDRNRPSITNLDLRDTDDTGQYSNDNLTKDTNVRFTWTGNSNGGSGIRQYWYGWNTSANDYSTGYEYADASAPSANGTYTFYVGAEAVSGLWAYYPDYSDQETVTWDTEPPAPPTFGSPAEWQDLADTTPALSWSAPFDTSGIWHYEVKLRAHSFPLDMEEHVFGYPTYNITGTTFTVPIGDALGYKAFGWQLSATDKAGNVGSLGRNGIADEWGHFNVVEAPAPKPTTPDPGDASVSQAISLTLSWQSGGGTTASFDIYFGTSTSPTFKVSQTGITYNPGTLQTGTTYFWRIDSKNGSGAVTTGDTWTFTTCGNSSPCPEQGNTTHQEYGDALYVYLDLYQDGYGNDYNYNHAGIFCGIDSNGTARTFESFNPQGPDHGVFSSNFPDRGNDYYGAYIPNTYGSTMPFTNRAAIVAKALQSVNASGIGYPLLAANAIEFEPTWSAPIEPNMITSLRCDGLVEYAYERCGIRLWRNCSSNDTEWSIAYFPASHNFMPDNNRDPQEELSPWAQRGAPPATGPIVFGGEYTGPPWPDTRMTKPSAIRLPSITCSVLEAADSYVDIEIAASDESGIFKITYNKPDGPGDDVIYRNPDRYPISDTLYSPVIRVTNLGTNPRVFLARSTDHGGNTSTNTAWNILFTPPKATSPNPAAGSTGRPIDQLLSWTGNASAASYDVYFGTSPSPDYTGTQTTTSFSPGGLAYETTYYWRIDARNAAGTTPGDLWSFTTGSGPPAKAVNPTPVSGATGRPLALSLTWADGGGASSYDVYFGTDPTPDASEYEGERSSTTFTPPTLSYSTTYYWRIDSKNEAGTTAGDVWSFTTQSDPQTRIIALAGNLNFGGVDVGAPISRTLTISNSGTAALTVTSISYPMGFSGSWTGSVPAGGSQDVTVTFTPTAGQSYGGTVTVNSNKTSGTDTIGCSGTGIARIIGLSGNLAFGNIVIGGNGTATLTISNSGNGPLTVNSINYPSGFSGNWSGSIPAGGSQDVTVTFTPTAEGSYGGTVSVSSDKTSGANTIACSGNGVPATRVINLSGDLAFGNVTVGQEAVRTLTIANTGNSTLSISGISFPTGFSGGWSGAIPAGRMHDVNVTFSPSVEGPHGGIIAVSSDRTAGTETIDCSGTGVPPTRIIRLAGDLAFGDVSIGRTVQRTFTIHNDGDSTLNVSGISYPSGFSGNWSGAIQAGSSANVTVTFAPVSEQEYGGTLTVGSDKTAGVDLMDCSGRGLPQTRTIRLTGTLDFGAVPVGSNSVENLTIHNDGMDPLEITGITNAPGFHGNCVTQIAASGTVEVPITFSPTNLGPYGGILKVLSDATSGEDTIPESGFGQLSPGAFSNVLANPSFEDFAPYSISPWTSTSGVSTSLVASAADLDGIAGPDGIIAPDGENVVRANWDISTASWQNALLQNFPILPEYAGMFWRARLKVYLPASSPTIAPPGAAPALKIETYDSRGTNVNQDVAYIDPAKKDQWQEVSLFGVFSAKDVGRTNRFLCQAGQAWSGTNLLDDAVFEVGWLGPPPARWTGAGASAAWADGGNWQDGSSPGPTNDTWMGSGFASGSNIVVGGSKTISSLTVDPGNHLSRIYVGQTPGAETLQLLSGRLTRTRSFSTNSLFINPNIDFGTPLDGVAIIDNVQDVAQLASGDNSRIRLSGRVTGDCDVQFVTRGPGQCQVDLYGEGAWSGKTILGHAGLRAYVGLYHTNAIPAGSPIEVRNAVGASQLYLRTTNVFSNPISLMLDSASGPTPPDFWLNADLDVQVTLSGMIRNAGSKPWGRLVAVAAQGARLTLAASNDLSGVSAVVTGTGNSNRVGTVVLGNPDCMRGAPEIQFQSFGGSLFSGGGYSFPMPFRVAREGLKNAQTTIGIGGIHPSGAAEFSGPQFWTNSTANGATLRLHCENAGAITRFSGGITDGAYSINMEKTGAGEVVLAGSNSWSGPTTLKAGRLTPESAGALPSESTLVFAGGELSLNGASIMMSSLAVRINGGVLEFGTGSGAAELIVTSGAVGTWDGTLSIRGFDPAVDRLRLGTSSTGASGNEARIRFVNPVGRAAGTYAARIDENGYIQLGGRTIEFAGVEWVMANGLADPENNQWADGDESVWVDETGLHLKIRNIGGTWRCAGITSVDATKEGLHRFWLSSRVDQLDRNVVATLGLRKSDGSGSLDIDFSTWGNASGPNARYAVQPGLLTEGINLRTLTCGLTEPESTQYIDWAGGQARFKSFRGHAGDIPGPADPRHLDDWTSTAATIPVEGDGVRICIQLWLAGAAAPSDGQEAELVVRAAEFPPGVAALGQKTNALVNPSFENAVPPSMAPWSGGGSSAVASNLNLDGGALDGIVAKHGTNVLWIDHDGTSDSFYQYYWFKPEDVGKGWRASLAVQIPSTDPPTNTWTLGHQPRMNVWWSETNWTGVINGSAYYEPAQAGSWQDVELTGIVSVFDVGRRLEFKAVAGSTYGGSALYDDAHFDLGTAFGESTAVWTPSGEGGSWTNAGRWSTGRVPEILDDAVVIAGSEPETTVTVDGEQIVYSLAVDNSGTTGAVLVGSAPHAGRLHVVSGRVVTPLSSNESPFAINADIDFGKPQSGMAAFDAWRCRPPVNSGRLDLHIYGDIAGTCDVKFLQTQGGSGEIFWNLHGTGKWSGKTVLGDDTHMSRVLIANPAAIPAGSTIECAGNRTLVIAFATNMTVPNDILVPRGGSENASRAVAVRANDRATVNLAGRIITQGPLSQGWLTLVAGEDSTLILGNTANNFDGLGRIITGSGSLGSGKRGCVVLARSGVFSGAADIYYQTFGGSWVLGDAFELTQDFYVASVGLSNSWTIITLGGIHSSGTAEFSGAQFWTNSTANGATLELHCENAGAVTRFSGEITDGDYNINVEKTGAGEVVLAGNNSWSGPLTVSNGVLTVALASAVPAESSLIIGAGTVNLDGFDATMVSLDVSSDSAVVDFGDDGKPNDLVFTTGAAGDWAGRLTVEHFDPENDHFRLGTSAAAAGNNEGHIHFLNPAGQPSGTYGAVIDDNGFVTLGTIQDEDADHDGMPDAWEAVNFGSTAAAPHDDADGDRFTNIQEYWAGTNPMSAGSMPCIRSMTCQAADVVLRFDSVVGRKYRIESSDDMKNWNRVVQDNVMGTGGQVEIVDPGGREAVRRFYRIIVTFESAPGRTGG